MDLSASDRDQASWAYFVSFASLGLGLPIPFLSLVAGVVFHAVVHRRSPFVAFHSWRALLLGLPASLVVGVWSCWGLAVLNDLFLSAGQVVGDLTAFWVLGAAAAALLTAEVVLGLKGAKNAKNGAVTGFGALDALCARLSRLERSPSSIS
jgi:hypothetical protein